MMGDFSTPFARFDSALAAVKEKKVAKDAAQDALNKANLSYNDAVIAAEKIRQEVNDLLNGLLPGGPSDRVRVSQ